MRTKAIGGSLSKNRNDAKLSGTDQNDKRYKLSGTERVIDILQPLFVFIIIISR